MCWNGDPTASSGVPSAVWGDSTNPPFPPRAQCPWWGGHSKGSQETLRTHRHNKVGVNLGLWHPLCTPRNWGHWQLRVSRERHPPLQGHPQTPFGGTPTMPKIPPPPAPKTTTRGGSPPHPTSFIYKGAVQSGEPAAPHALARGIRLDDLDIVQGSVLGVGFHHGQAPQNPHSLAHPAKNAVLPIQPLCWAQR